MNILVTGGAGFIGSHIVDGLVKKNHNVFIIDSLITGQKDLINIKATFYEEDITDYERIFQIIKENNIEIICHQAAHIDLRESIENPQFDANVNIVGTLNLFEAARKCKVRKIVLASSGGVYGDTNQIPTTETHPTNPPSPYGISKLITEKYASYYKDVHGLDFTVFRYSNVYGPRQNSKGEAGVVSVFISKMLNNSQCYIYGNGENTRDFVYVQDVADANIMAILGDLSGIYNVCSSTQTSINHLFDLIKNETQSDQSKKYLDARVGEQKHSCLSFSKINQDIGWKPKVSIEEGIKLTVRSFK